MGRWNRADIGTLVLGRQRGNPEHSDSRAWVGNPRGHLRLELTDDTQTRISQQSRGGGPAVGPEGRRLTWRAHITALTVY